jgi:hypothetical protein
VKNVTQSATANHSEIGISFEQFIINEVRAYISYRRRDINIYFWRSRNYVVDLLIGDEIAIEIKFAEKVKNEFFDGLLALKQENLQKQFHLVGRFSRGGEYKDCRYWNWQVFLETLWQDKLF